MDSFELAAWLVFVSLLGIPGLARIPAVRRAAASAGGRLLERLTREPEPDQDALDLYEALRRERLLRDVDRLRRVVATDEAKSAVRQIGNRMAYDQLLRELAEVRDLAPPARTTPAPTRRSRWTDQEPGPGPLVPVAAPWSTYAGQQPTQVETLEIGRRPARRRRDRPEAVTTREPVPPSVHSR